MKTMMMILMIVLFAETMTSQTTSRWNGNTPGHERDWFLAANWSNNRVPDEFSDVIIPVDISIDRNYPVINGGTTTVEINSLSIWPGATITLKTGTLSILDPERSYFSLYQILGNGHITMSHDVLWASREQDKFRP
jgi:hypothetical protein